jgi:hypothetical protein
MRGQCAVGAERWLLPETNGLSRDVTAPAPCSGSALLGTVSCSALVYPPRCASKRKDDGSAFGEPQGVLGRQAGKRAWWHCHSGSEEEARSHDREVLR